MPLDDKKVGALGDLPIWKRILEYVRSHTAGSRLFRLCTGVGKASLFVLPFGVFFYHVFRYGADIPVQDDYGVVLEFLINWLKTHALMDRLALLVTQQNEHRAVFEKLSALAEYYLSGRVNFFVLTVFGTIGWALSILLLSFVLMKKQGLTLAQLLPIPYLLLVFTQFNNMFMASAAIAFYWEIFFSLAVFICLAQKKTIAACLFFVASLMTTANGVPLFPIGAAYLVLFKRWRAALIYSISCLIFTSLYFTNYQAPASLSLTGILRSAGTVLVFPLAFMGNLYPSVPAAVILGALASVAFAYFVLRRTGEQEHFLSLTAIWLLTTSVLAALARYDFGLEMAISSRYAPFSLLVAVLIYVWILKTSREAPAGPFQSRSVSLLAFILSAALFLASVFKAESEGFFAIVLQDKIANLSVMAQSGDVSRLPIPDKRKEGIGKALIAARQIGFYDYKNVLGMRYPTVTPVPMDAHAAYKGNVDSFDGMRIWGWAAIPQMDSSRSAIFIILRSAQRTLALRPIRTTRSDVAYVYKQPQYYDSGYQAFLAAYSVPAGNYEIGISVENGGTQAIHWTGSTYLVP